MKTLIKIVLGLPITALLLWAAFPAPVVAQGTPLAMAMKTEMCQTLHVASTTAVEFFATSTHTLTGRKSLCIFNNDTTSTNKVFKSSISRIGDGAGVPIFGGGSFCLDQGPNIKVFLYEGATIATGSVTVCQWE